MELEDFLKQNSAARVCIQLLRVNFRVCTLPWK